MIKAILGFVCKLLVFVLILISGSIIFSLGMLFFIFWGLKKLIGCFRKSGSCFVDVIDL